MNFVINHDPETTTMKAAACPKSNTLLIVLRIIALAIAGVLALLALGGCVAVNHTLKDGTQIRASAAGASVTMADGKSSIDLTLPKK